MPDCGSPSPPVPRRAPGLDRRPARRIEAELGLALDQARRQGARALELRAATSLLRFRLARGSGRGVAEARRLLASIVDALPEAADAADVRQAVSILALG